VPTFYNRTRVSSSIPKRLLGDGKWFLVPLYGVMRTSDLAREGIERSGSWRFADHIYRGRASGRYVIGTAVDALLLRLPSARSFRLRHLFIRREVERLVSAGARRVLSVASGVPRDLAEAAAALGQRGARFFALDLDPEPLVAARALVGELGVAGAFEMIEADAFDASRWPVELDVVTSTGFGEFLDEEQLAAFYRLCHDALAPGGTLLTTAQGRHRLSDYLLREIGEIHARYRTAEELRTVLGRGGFHDVRTSADARGLQTFAIATKGAA
jgi:SAM-dependent methyltransferase